MCLSLCVSAVSTPTFIYNLLKGKETSRWVGGKFGKRCEVSWWRQSRSLAQRARKKKKKRRTKKNGIGELASIKRAACYSRLLLRYYIVPIINRASMPQRGKKNNTIPSVAFQWFLPLHRVRQDYCPVSLALFN